MIPKDSAKTVEAVAKSRANLSGVSSNKCMHCIADFVVNLSRLVSNFLSLLSQASASGHPEILSLIVARIVTQFSAVEPGPLHSGFDFCMVMWFQGVTPRAR